MYDVFAVVYVFVVSPDETTILYPVAPDDPVQDNVGVNDVVELKDTSVGLDRAMS